MIALSMGEKGQIVRLLAAKYGGHLTFAAMSPERASAPGQPDIGKLVGLYNYRWAGTSGRYVDVPHAYEGRHTPPGIPQPRQSGRDPKGCIGRMG